MEEALAHIAAAGGAGVGEGASGVTRSIGTYGLSGLVLIGSGALWLIAQRQRRGGGALALFCLLALAAGLVPSATTPGPAQRPLLRVVQSTLRPVATVALQSGAGSPKKSG